MNEPSRYSRVSWAELIDMPFPSLSEDHPWPKREILTLRVYSVPLQCEHFAFSVGRLEPGQSVYHHRHREAEEIYLLMVGRSQIRIGDETIDANPLDAFRIPPEIYRSVYNHSPDPCWWIFIGAPTQEFLEKSDYVRPGHD